MKITIGKTAWADGGFKVEDSEGRDITDQLNVKTLRLELGGEPHMTTVHLECYADCIEILEPDVAVTVVERQKPLDPSLCATCGNPEDNHPFRHPFRKQS